MRRTASGPRYALFQVDAFAEAPFTGNPAAVCFLERARSDAWLQNVAQEMNLSETAFLRQLHDGFELRWFTPVAEVDLCGHATLASAHVLFEIDRLRPDQVARFHTRSGELTARRRECGIEIDLPAEPPEPASAPPGLAEALGATPRSVARNRLDYVVELASEEAVRSLAPDLARIREYDAEGVIVTSLSESPELDFVSRYFAPRFGIDEDPVTGAAHCALGPYWSRRLGRGELSAFQASNRGGRVALRLAGDRVLLTGGAVTVMRGELDAG